MPRFSRILLKLSGEILRDGEDAFHGPRMAAVSQAVSKVCQSGVQVGIVVGGGNLLRGRDHARGRSQAEVDQIGMLATVLNVGMLRFHLEDTGLVARVFAPRALPPVAEAFERRRVIGALERGEVALFGGGTGNPFFSTDSAAALRAIELECDAVLKGTMVDGIYDKDPNRHDDAQRLDNVSFGEAMRRDLRVMDQTAFALCRDHDMPVVVFDIREPSNLVDVVDGKVAGSVVSPD